MPKCLFNTIRRQRTSHGISDVDAGMGSSIDGSDSSDCSTGTTRPTRSRQRKAVKRKPSLSHLSVVTRFYMHTERKKDEADTKKAEDKLKLSLSTSIQTLLPRDDEPFQTSMRAKHSRRENKPRSVRLKRVHTAEHERNAEISDSNNSGGSKQGRDPSDLMDDRQQQVLNTAVLGLVDITRQCSSAVLQLPAYTDSLASLNAAPDSLGELTSSDQSTAVKATTPGGQDPQSAQLTSIGVQQNQEAGKYPESTGPGFPCLFTSGIVLDNHIIPLAVMQPVWCASARPLSIASLLPAFANFAANKASLQMNVVSADSRPVQSTDTGHSLLGAEQPRSSTLLCSGLSTEVVSPLGRLISTADEDSNCCISACDKTPVLNSVLNVLSKEAMPHTGTSPNNSLQISSQPISGHPCSSVLRELSQKSTLHNLPQSEAVSTVCSVQSKECVVSLKDSSSENTKLDPQVNALIFNVRDAYKQELSKDNDDHPASKESTASCSQGIGIEIDELNCSLTQIPVLGKERIGMCFNERPTFSSPQVLSSSSLPRVHITNTPWPKPDKPMNSADHPVIDIEVNESRHPEGLPVHIDSTSCGNEKAVVSSGPGKHSCQALDLEPNKIHKSSDASNEEHTHCPQRPNLGIVNVQNERLIETHHRLCNTMEYQNKISIMHSSAKDIVTHPGSSLAASQDAYVTGIQDKHSTGYGAATLPEQPMNRSIKEVSTSIGKSADVIPTSLLDQRVNKSHQRNMSMSKQPNFIHMQYHGIQQKLGGVSTPQQSSVPDSQVTSITTQPSNINVRRQDSCKSERDILPAAGRTDRRIPGSQTRQPESRAYNSKWISTVAACLLAQPSSFSVVPHTSINDITANVFRPSLFAPASSTGAMHSLNSLPSGGANCRTIPSTTSPVVVKSRKSQVKIKGKSSSVTTANPLHNLLTSSSGYRRSGTGVNYCRDARQDSVLFYSPNSTKHGGMESVDETGPLLTSKGKVQSCHRCSVCSQDCLTAQDLHYHMLAHKNSSGGLGSSSGYGGNVDLPTQRGNQADPDVGDARNKCAVCSRVFTRSWLLKGHMRTHTGERPFRCTWPQCQRAFADKSNLRSHTLIHTTTAKSFTCPKCSRAFSQKRYLHKHMLEVCRII